MNDIQALDALVLLSEHGQSILCGLASEERCTHPPTYHVKERFMEKLVEVKTLVRNVDIKSMGVEGLIQTIKDLENEKASLDAISTQSAKLDARKIEIDDTLKLVAAELDARA